MLINLLPYKSLDRKCCEHNSEKHSKGKSRFLLASCWPETDINQHSSTGYSPSCKINIRDDDIFLHTSVLTVCDSFGLIMFLLRFVIWWLHIRQRKTNLTIYKIVLLQTGEKVNSSWYILQFRNIKNVAFVSVIYDELVARQLLPKQ